ncbi:TIGR02757 family protein [Melittangium boletus]|nr:TIGR02757 family protein [Melittangium boletus]
MASTDSRARIAFDPLEFPHRYRDPRDIEVSALLAAALAYGRADLFRPKVDALLQRMGASPAAFVRELDVEGARALLQGFVYRFNVGTDVAVLLLGMGRALREHGSLEALFVQGLDARGSWHGALAAFTAALRDVPMAPLRKALGPERGLQHLLPSPLGAGAAKRLNLFLRWMVRGPDGVDLGIWKRVRPSALLIPLDTHIGRISKHLGLTRRNDLSWRTAEEVTASLRALDAEDPVRFDFALCHYGMSGVCPTKPVVEHCTRCLLLPACGTGQKTVKAGGVRATR